MLLPNDFLSLMNILNVEFSKISIAMGCGHCPAMDLNASLGRLFMIITIKTNYPSLAVLVSFALIVCVFLSL